MVKKLNQLGNKFSYYSNLIFNALEKIKEDGVEFYVHSRYLNKEEYFDVSVIIVDVDREYFDVEVYSNYYGESFILRMCDIVDIIKERRI